MTFMLEAENYNPWLEAAAGYLTQPLNAYDNNPVWTKDPKNTVFRDAGKRTLPASGIGPVSEKSAAAISDFILVDMVANYCTGREDVKGAIAQAERAGQAPVPLSAELRTRRTRGCGRLHFRRAAPIRRASAGERSR